MLRQLAVRHHRPAVGFAIHARRRFTKSLRYNLAASQHMAALVFTDTERPTAAYLIEDAEDREAIDALRADTGTDTWAWVIGDPMPPLPPARHTPAPRTEHPDSP